MKTTQMRRAKVDHQYKQRPIVAGTEFDVDNADVAVMLQCGWIEPQPGDPQYIGKPIAGEASRPAGRTSVADPDRDGVNATVDATQTQIKAETQARADQANKVAETQTPTEQNKTEDQADPGKTVESEAHAVGAMQTTDFMQPVQPVTGEPKAKAGDRPKASTQKRGGTSSKAD